MHDSCDCDMCVDEKHVVKMMKHLLMIQKLMLIKLMLMKLMLTKHMLIKTMWIKAIFKYVDENHVDRNHDDRNHVNRMTLCMLHNEGIFSNKFVDFRVIASRQSAFSISELSD